MRENLVRHSVGRYCREMIRITKNLNDRENPQGRLEDRFKRMDKGYKIWKAINI